MWEGEYVNVFSRILRCVGPVSISAGIGVKTEIVFLSISTLKVWVVKYFIVYEGIVLYIISIIININEIFRLLSRS